MKKLTQEQKFDDLEKALTVAFADVPKDKVKAIALEAIKGVARG